MRSGQEPTIDPAKQEQLTTRLAGVRLAVFDVDGTLTDGAIVYAEGLELQRFDVRDGQGLVWLRQAGIELAFISGRGCEATRRRARELGVGEVHLRSGPKGAVLEELQERLGIAPEATLAMGDDVPDLALFERAAVGACPCDAVDAVRTAADLVAAREGGRGAAREIAERLLAAQGRLAGFLEGGRR